MIYCSVDQWGAIQVQSSDAQLGSLVLEDPCDNVCRYRGRLNPQGVPAAWKSECPSSVPAGTLISLY